MPITKGAIRKLRADKRKTEMNARAKRVLREAVSVMRKKPTGAGLIKVFKAADRAAKSKVIHKNKAARIKSRASRMIKKK